MYYTFTDYYKTTNCEECMKKNVCKYKDKFKKYEDDIEKIHKDISDPFRAPVICKEFMMNTQPVGGRAGGGGGNPPTNWGVDGGEYK